jgi:hypothetical protein
MDIEVDDSKPFILLQISFEGGSNVVIINPFSATLETFSSMLLIRSSDSSSTLNLFPVYANDIKRAARFSCGLLHYERSYDGTYRDDSNPLYLFQIFEPYRPKLFFQLLPEQQLTFYSLFENYKEVEEIPIDLSTESFLYMSTPNRSAYSNGMTVTLWQRRPIWENPSAVKAFDSLNVDLANSYGERDQRAGLLELINRRYASMFQGTVFDWQYSSEGWFDNLFGIFQYRAPLQVEEQIELGDLSDLADAKQFCRAFSIKNGKMVCSAKGWVLLFKFQLQIFYGLTWKDGVKFKYTSECGGISIVENSLLTICQNGIVRNMVVINLIDLTEKRYPLPQSALTPESAKALIAPQPATPRRETHIQYLKLIQDESGMNFVANTHTFECIIEYNKNNSRLASPTNLIKIREVFKSEGKLTGTALGITTNSSLAKASSIKINKGTGISIKLYEDSYYTYNFSQTNPTYTGVSKQIVGTVDLSTPNIYFQINGSKELRKVIFDNAGISELILNENDLIDTPQFPGDTVKYIRFNLMILPNYHSYIIRHTNSFLNTTLTIYKLENPFAENVNLYTNNEPVCYRWACILVSQFESKYFIKVYDIDYELKLRRQVKSNIGVTVNCTTPPDLVVYKATSYDLDQVTDEYTFFPIQILNSSTVRSVVFDTSSAVPQDETLTLLVFGERLTKYSLKRNLTVTMGNLYFASNYFKIDAVSNYAVRKQFNLNIIKYKENNYSKYWLHVTAILVIGSFLAITSLLTRVRTIKSNRIEPIKKISENTEEKVLLTSE